MISRTFNASFLRPILIGYAVVCSVAIATTLAMACYPTDCDPRTDPTRCQCPPGVCGPYPSPPAPPPIRQSSDRSDAGDAGKDGAR